MTLVLELLELGEIMPPKLRQHILTKLVAIGFIYLIIIGNIWFGLSITTKVTPVWLQSLFGIGVLWVVATGFLLVAYGGYAWFTGALEEGDDDSSGDSV